MNLLRGLLFIFLFQWGYALNLQYISRLIMTFNGFVKFQDLGWYVSQQLNGAHMDNVEKLIRVIGDAFELTQIVNTNNSEMRASQSALRRNLANFVFTTGPNDLILQVTNKVLIGRHINLLVVIMVDKVSDMEPIYDICRFLNRNQYENSLLYFESVDGINQLFGATEFPQMTIENRTDLRKFTEKKLKEALSIIRNVGGYQIETPLREDAPHLFRVGDRYEGSTYRIIETFVEHINGRFKELELPNDALGGRAVNMKQTLQLVRDRRVPFSAHAYALFMPDDELDKSYPLLVVRWCLMVPLYNSVSTYFYALQPFDWTIWFFVLGAFLLLCLLELFWLFLGSANAAEGPIAALLNSYCYIINISTGRELLHQPSVIRFLLLFAVFFHGFFLSANYTSTLGSILAVNLFHAQLNTMDDIIIAQLPVMIIDYELDFLLQLHTELPLEFRKLLRPVDSGIYAQHQLSFNSSFAYFVTEDTWQFLDGQQQHLKQRKFKLSDICFGSYHLAYPMQKDSSLWRDLEYYTFRVHSSGLLYYYARLSFESALHAGLVQRLQENKDYESAGLQHLVIAFFFLVAMSAIAAIVFALEVLLARSSRA